MSFGISGREWRRLGTWLTFGGGLALLYLALEEWVKPRLSTEAMFFWAVALLLVGAYVFKADKVKI